MKIEIYRKRYVMGMPIVDDEPEITYNNVFCIEIAPKHIYGNINGEELTIKTDHYNYKYSIVD
jgi:hypothetical protein